MPTIAVSGVSGKMGSMIYSRLQNENGLQYVGGIDQIKNKGIPRIYSHVAEIIPKPEVLIDFSLPENTLNQLTFCSKNQIAAVIGTTGFSESEKDQINKYSKQIPIVLSANFSVGISVLLQVAEIAAKLLKGYDIEIIEKHHRQKKDAPSGTALTLGEKISQIIGSNLKDHFLFGRKGKENERKNEIGFHSVRGGTVVGEHRVLFLGNSEEIELVHKAQSREIFAEGAIRAAKFIYHRAPGLYSMEDVLKG
jgi:4-hydroxy-tetrahydrodipicolinate reductase